MGQSRVENILEATINGDPYDTPPYSRVEKLLLDLKTSSEGGTRNYNELENLPTLNGTQLKGNMDSKDVGVEGDMEYRYDPATETVTLG